MIKNLKLRLNLDVEAEKRVYDYLQNSERSISKEAIRSINEYRRRYLHCVGSVQAYRAKRGQHLFFEYKERLAKISEMEQNKDDFLKAIRKFMEMESLTAPMLRELIDHIDVYEKEGGKKNYTQRIVIYYRFVGYLELPSSENENYKANTRKGVDVEYIPAAKSA